MQSLYGKSSAIMDPRVKQKSRRFYQLTHRDLDVYQFISGILISSPLEFLGAFSIHEMAVLFGGDSPQTIHCDTYPLDKEPFSSFGCLVSFFSSSFLDVYPKSHLIWKNPALLKELEYQSVEVPPGFAVVFDSLLVHGGGVNKKCCGDERNERLHCFLETKRRSGRKKTDQYYYTRFEREVAERFMRVGGPMFEDRNFADLQ